MPSKSGNAAVERVAGLKKQLTVVISITSAAGPAVTYTVLSVNMPPELASNSVNFDLITANGVGTIAPEFTFSGINTTTAPVLGFEILDTEATALLGGGGYYFCSGVANANNGVVTIQSNAAVVSSGTVGGVTSKGQVVGYLTFSGVIGSTSAAGTTLVAATGTGNAVFTIEWI